MTTTSIRQEDLIESIAGALQYISYYHPTDYIAHLARAYEREKSPAAKDAIAQILTNSQDERHGPAPHLPGHRHRQRLPEGGHGREVGRLRTRQPGSAIDEGVRRGYNHPDNTLRASVRGRPAASRARTPRTTPPP